jgi:hypothetical protein
MWLRRLGVCVYVISEKDSAKPCKIGYASNVESRLACLTMGNPRPLVVRLTIPVSSRERARELEGELHEALKHCALRYEWFDVEWTAIEALLPGANQQRIVPDLFG